MGKMRFFLKSFYLNSNEVKSLFSRSFTIEGVSYFGYILFLDCIRYKGNFIVHRQSIIFHSRDLSSRYHVGVSDDGNLEIWT